MGPSDIHLPCLTAQWLLILTNAFVVGRNNTHIAHEGRILPTACYVFLAPDRWVAFARLSVYPQHASLEYMRRAPKTNRPRLFGFSCCPSS